MPGLRLFTAETAAHAPRLNAHIMKLQAQRMRHPVLHLAGMLCAAVNQPLPHLLRLRISHLAFKIKMLLAADFELALQSMLCSLQSAIRIAARHMHGRQHEMVLRHGLLCAQDRRQRLNIRLHQTRSAASRHHVIGNNERHHVAHVLHCFARKDRFIMAERSKDGIAGNVLRRDDAANARQSQRSGEIY